VTTWENETTTQTFFDRVRTRTNTKEPMNAAPYLNSSSPGLTEESIDWLTGIIPRNR